MSATCDCPLAGCQEVKYKGNLQGEIVFVGESPGFQELKYRDCFVGKAGKLLHREIAHAGIPEDLCFFLNSARCLIPKDEMSAKDVNKVLAACRQFVETAIHHIKPKIIIPMGAIALQQIMKMKGIKKARGTFYWSKEFDCWVLPNWHPAYILRNNNELENFQRVFGQLRAFVENGYEIDETDKFSYKEVESIRPLLDGALPKDSSDFFITAVDTETQGVKWFDENSITISYSVAASRTEGWQVYLHEEVLPGEGDFDILIQRGGTKKAPDLQIVGIKRVENYEQKVAELKELCANPKIKKYFMNLKYDKHRLEGLGITELVNAPMDVALAAHCIDSSRYMNASLGYLLESFCGISGQYKDEFTDTEKMDMLLQVKENREKVNRYAGYDAVSTLRVGEKVRQQLIQDAASTNYYINFAHPIETELLYELESNGILIDEDELPRIEEEVITMMEEAISDFQRLCPEAVVIKHKEQFRLTRRAILVDALFKYDNADSATIDLGFSIAPVEISPKTKQPKCDKAVMKILLDRDIPKQAKDLIKAYQQWAEYNTLLTRYIRQIEDWLGPDSRLYPSYSLTFTSSGRTGARQPSIQNFPKRSKAAKLIRRLLIAPPGKMLLEVDHSMSELRWIAHVANERTMKKIFSNGGDIHLTTGLEIGGYRGVEGIDEELLAEIRRNAKAVNFGLCYGMSARGLKNYAYQSYDIVLTDQRSIDWRNTFFALYHDLPHWHEETKILIQQQGFVRTAFGRKIPIPNIYSDDRVAQAEAERFGINVIIQGPSSDYTLLGGHRVMKSDYYDRDKLSIAIFIHDAFVFEVDAGMIEEYFGLIKSQMENIDTSKFKLELSVPFKAEGEFGLNLADMEKLELRR